MIAGSDSDPETPEAVRPPRGAGRRWLRGVISLWLIFHLAAIIIAPASAAPSSDLIRAACGLVQPYLDVLYLDHGYHFFAPEPAESTLLAFEAERADGSVARGRIPDRATRPRLLYHRYFMLTEHMVDAPESLQTLWLGSYARQIGREYGARRVTLFEQTHNLPTMERVRGGGRLTDPESYEEHPLGAFRCDGF